MQQPPLYVRMPDTEERDSMRALPDMAMVGIVALIVTVAVFVILTMIHGAHEWHGDRAASAEFMACSNAAFDEAITTGKPYDVDHCKPVMPWYAEHPGWYALAIGAAVLVIGRGYVFMRRLEAGRGH